MAAEFDCSMCKLTKPRAEFSEESRTVRGVSRRCKACVCAVAKALRDADRDGYNARNRQWKRDNVHKNRRASARWAALNHERKRALDKAYGARPDVRAKHKEQNQAYAERNREKLRSAQLAKYYRDPAQWQVGTTRHRIMKKFGIPRDAYNVLAARQQFGRCDACGQPETRKNTRGTIWRLSIDHDHETGEIRGVLCGNCNSALGLLMDDVATIRKLADYLESRQKKRNADSA